MIVLITDGNPTVEVDFLQAEARLIKSLGTRIVGVGVTSEVADCADIMYRYYYCYYFYTPV